MLYTGYTYEKRQQYSCCLLITLHEKGVGDFILPVIVFQYLRILVFIKSGICEQTCTKQNKVSHITERSWPFWKIFFPMPETGDHCVLV